MTAWRNWLCRVLWGVGLVALTIGLLTTQTAQAVDATVPEEAHFSLSKSVHFLAYMTMTLLLAGTGLPLGVRWGLLVFLALHAGATEYLQTFVPMRTGTPLDVLIDHTGIFLGVALTWRTWLGRPRPPSADSGGGGPTG